MLVRTSPCASPPVLAAPATKLTFTPAVRIQIRGRVEASHHHRSYPHRRRPRRVVVRISRKRVVAAPTLTFSMLLKAIDTAWPCVATAGGQIDVDAWQGEQAVVNDIEAGTTIDNIRTVARIDRSVVAGSANQRPRDGQVLAALCDPVQGKSARDTDPAFSAEVQNVDSDPVGAPPERIQKICATKRRVRTRSHTRWRTPEVRGYRLRPAPRSLLPTGSFATGSSPRSPSRPVQGRIIEAADDVARDLLVGRVSSASHCRTGCIGDRMDVLDHQVLGAFRKRG